MLETARDIAIIVLAVLSIVLVALMITLLVMARQALGPIMKSAQSTMQNVQATTAMVSEITVSPIIRVAGVVAGIRAMAEALAKRDRNKGGSHE